MNTVNTHQNAHYGAAQNGQGCVCIEDVITVRQGTEVRSLPGRIRPDRACPIHGLPPGCSCPLIEDARLSERTPGTSMYGLDPACPAHGLEAEVKRIHGGGA